MVFDVFVNGNGFYRFDDLRLEGLAYISCRINIVERIVNYFKEKGFKKRSNKLFKRTEDELLIIEFQSSRYFEGVYINVGVFFLGVADEKRLVIPVYDCHLEHRVNELAIEISDVGDEKITEKLIEPIVSFFDNATNIEWLLSDYPNNFKAKDISLQKFTYASFKEYLKGKEK